MVLVAALGPTMQPETAIRIRAIDWNGRALIPRVEITRSDDAAPDASGRPVRTWSPYELVVVPTSDENVTGFAHEPPPPARSKEGSGLPIPGLR
jgi:hypothetical protein